MDNTVTNKLQIILNSRNILIALSYESLSWWSKDNKSVFLFQNYLEIWALIAFLGASDTHKHFLETTCNF